MLTEDRVARSAVVHSLVSRDGVMVASTEARRRSPKTVVQLVHVLVDTKRAREM